MNVNVTMMVDGGGAGFSRRDKWLKKSIYLPFAPFPGLQLKAGEWEAEIETVTFDIWKDEFTAVSKPDRIMLGVPVSGKTAEAVQEIVDDYLEQGWEESK